MPARRATALFAYSTGLPGRSMSSIRMPDFEASSAERSNASSSLNRRFCSANVSAGSALAVESTCCAIAGESSGFATGDMGDNVLIAEQMLAIEIEEVQVVDRTH